MGAEKRYGNQVPTNSIVLPYDKTDGPLAIDIYKKTGRTPQPWQEQLIYDILAKNDDDLFVHTKYGYSVPRRNGKGEVLTIRELYGLMTGERIIHTAHRTTTSSNASLRLADLLRAMGYKEVKRVTKEENYENCYVYAKQFGLERIRVLGEGGGQVDFRTRTSTGGLGEGFDLMVIDEAQEYTQDQESTLQYVVSDSANPQILLCGTPPTMVSHGTVFQHLRNNCLRGDTEDTGWAEWSVAKMSDVNDVEIWYQCNPAMGWQLNERKVRAENKDDEIDFNIQRYGLWLTYNQQSAISKAEWNELKVDSLPQFASNVFAGVKFGVDGTNACLSVAVKTADDKVFVESLDCMPIRSGVDWIVDYLVAMRPQTIILDGENGKQMLLDKLKQHGVKGTLTPTVKEVIAAHSLFEQSLEAKTICHKGQPALEQSVSNCEKRAIGSNGGFGYRSLKDNIEVGLLESVILAHWGCCEAKERKKQVVIC